MTCGGDEGQRWRGGVEWCDWGRGTGRRLIPFFISDVKQTDSLFWWW